MRVARLVVNVVLPGVVTGGSVLGATELDWMPEAQQELTAELVARYGEEQQRRIERGLAQVAGFWRAEDGDRAKEIAANIVVAPASGSGHAWGAAMRDAKTHLRTRVGADSMDYKGYNIAVHEMGHNVEQILSLNEIDYYILQGVPNTAFTGALAFVFQARDLDLLGLGALDEMNRVYQVLDDFWGAAEISVVALVNMRVWHWMYDRPEATAAELKDATLQNAKYGWNEHFAEIFNQRDVVLLGVYSHMIQRFLYLPDYPIGHIIALQVEEQMEKAGDLGSKFERMAKMGSVTPDLWMKNATGASVGPEALLAATERALESVRRQ